MNKWTKGLIVVSAILLFGYFNGFFRSGPKQYERGKRYEKFLDQPAPEVVTTTLDGREWVLQSQKGKVVLIDFWATWCGPCVASVPKMKQIFEKYRNHPDFLMVGVSLDSNAGAVKNFVADRKIGWLQLYDEQNGRNNRFARVFGVNAIPSVWLIDKEGRVAAADLYSEKKIIQKIDALL